MLVFIPAVGEFVIPALLGGPDALMIGRVLWEEFFNNRDWPVASAVAIAMLFVLVIPIMILPALPGAASSGRTDEAPAPDLRPDDDGRRLPVPVPADPADDRVTRSTSRAWSRSGAGFSTKWYGELFRNEQVLERCLAVVQDRGDERDRRDDPRHARRARARALRPLPRTPAADAAWQPRRW